MQLNIWGRLTCAVGALVLLLSLATLTRSPLVWRDEMVLAPIAYSLLQGGSGTPTVLAEDPRWPHSTLFYGPLYFRLGALSFKLFGLSITSWRLLSWLGGLLLACAAAYLIRVLGGSRNWAAACWALVLLSPELGSTLTSGRMDALAVGLELLGLAWLVRSLRGGWQFTLAAGTAWACAALTTPRALTFFFWLAVGAIFWLKEERAVWHGVMLRLAVSGLMVAASLCAWLWTEDETPLSWWHYVNTVSQSSRQFALVGGFWQLRPTPLWALTPFVAFILLLTARGSYEGGFLHKAATAPTSLRWVTAALLGHSVMTYAITARPESYAIYWTLPGLITALAWVAILSTGRNRAGTLRPVLLCLLLIAGLYGGFRTLKLAEVAANWQARDPQPLEDFARQHIPPGSRVLGPLEFYFYAVERAGSTYRFHEPLNDTYFPFVTDRLNPAYPATVNQQFTAHYLIWPAERPLPASCRCTEADIVAHYESPAVRAPALDALRFPDKGYPATNLYRLLR